MRAHQLFSDPEWDGEPVEPEVRKPRLPGDPPTAKEPPPPDWLPPTRPVKIKVKRTLWSAPDTRKALLFGLADKGFGVAAMTEMQKLIEAEHSDLFDVLAYVAYARAPVMRHVRAARAHDASALELGERQQAFVDFVLEQYVSQGVGELDSDKLSPLLKLRYKNAMADALKDLGGAEEIRHAFIGFQRHLYQSGELS